MWYDDLFTKAVARRSRVAAKLTSEAGVVYYGVNVESSCPSLSVCAERVAILMAVVSEGPGLKIRSIEVKALKDGITFDINPCGACRQLTAEFSLEHTTLCGELVSKLYPRPYL